MYYKNLSYLSSSKQRVQMYPIQLPFPTPKTRMILPYMFQQHTKNLL